MTLAGSGSFLRRAVDDLVMKSVGPYPAGLARGTLTESVQFCTA